MKRDKNLTKSNKNLLKGGAERVIPLYKEPINSPFIPNQQKQLYGERIAETAPKTYAQPETDKFKPRESQAQSQQQSQQNQLVNLQIYQQPKPREAPRPAVPTLLLPSGTTPYCPPQFSYQFPPFMTSPYFSNQQQAAIMKTYNINIDGVTGDHSKLSLIYEDILPGKQISGTLATIGERLNIYNFIKAMMFSQGDGKNVGLDGKSDDSLLSHLKFMDLNPYNTYKLSLNPYKGLPLGFLIYRSCYPIRYDSSGSAVICAKNSVGMNIRIYKMTQGSYMVNNQPDKKFIDYEEWREMSYYEYVRDHILRKKNAPNFVMLYGYYISENSQIDFDKIGQMRGIQTPNEPKYISSAPKTSSLVSSQVSRTIPYVEIPGEQSRQQISQQISQLPQQTGGNEPCCPTDQKATISVQMLNPNAYLGKALVALTEAPTYNLFGWASKTYQIDGNIKRQINTGFHLDKVWYSIIFQIIIAMYCLQIHKIFFNEFNPEDHIYIKDVNAFGTATKFWKYVVDGIDYYIPNYGYIVMIESNFKDIPGVQTSVLNPNCGKQNITPGTHKLYAKCMDDNITDDIFKQQTFDAFRKSVDSNVFDQAFIEQGGCPPPPEVKHLLGLIKSAASNDTEKFIGKYVYTYMRRFMNNRVGTYLKEVEVQNIRRDEQRNITKGQLVVYEDGSSSYKFVIFINLVDQGIASILTKNEPANEDIIEMTVPITSLYGYSKMEQILQNYKPNESSLNEDDLLETYIVNKS